MKNTHEISRRSFLKLTGCTLAASCMGSGCTLQYTKFDTVYKNNALLGDGAQVSIAPCQSWRDKVGNYTITIKLGKEGLPSKDSLGIVNSSYMDRWQFTFPSHLWGTREFWQSVDKTGDNYVSASCNRKGTKMTVKTGTPLPKGHDNRPSHFVKALNNRKRSVLEITASEALKHGDVITIQWQKAKSPPYAMEYLFMPFLFSKLPQLDRDLPIRRGEFDDLPRVRVKGHTAVSLHVTCRPLQGVNEKFSLNIAAIDKYGNRAEDFQGQVNIISDESIGVKKSVSFDKNDKGCKCIEGLSGSKPGWFRIQASQGNVSGVSNYIVVSETEPDKRLYFGDMHNHTLDCDGTNDIHEHFRYGPDVAGLDFGGLSCHAEYFGCSAAWQRYLKEIAKANKPGKFVVFPGYEWAQQGHSNAYFLSEKDTLLIWGEKRMMAIGNPPDESQFRVGAKSEKEFMKILREHKKPAFVIAHVHTAYSKDIDDAVLWLDEIYSCHLHDRAEREQRLQNNLKRGFRLGVVAGSDMHRLTMGHLCKDPGKRWPQGGWETCQYQTAGLQGTYASELTRKELFEGMKDRCTYGTSGARIVLLFSCCGKPMGSQIKMKSHEKPDFRIEVGGTDILSEIVLCRYDGKQWSEPFKKQLKEIDWISIDWQDEEFTASGIYYARVTQQDGHQAWSSPVWVS